LCVYIIKEREHEAKGGKSEEKYIYFFSETEHTKRETFSSLSRCCCCSDCQERRKSEKNKRKVFSFSKKGE
jgi:hypothetical protein